MLISLFQSFMSTTMLPLWPMGVQRSWIASVEVYIQGNRTWQRQALCPSQNPSFCARGHGLFSFCSSCWAHCGWDTHCTSSGGGEELSQSHTHTLMEILKSDRRLFWHPHLSFFLTVRFCMWRWERFCPTVLCLSQCLSSLMWDHTSSTTLPVSHYMCSCRTHTGTNVYICKHYSSSIQFSIWWLVIYIHNIWQVQYMSEKNNNNSKSFFLTFLNFPEYYI